MKSGRHGPARHRATVLIDGGTRPATAAEMSGEGAGCVVWLNPADLSL